MLETRISDAVGLLLDLEHRRFGAQIGLLEPTKKDISVEFLLELVYAIDELSRTTISYQKRLAVQLIALTWEHISCQQRLELRDLLVTSLSRLGVGPSVIMLESDRDVDDHRRNMLTPLRSHSAEVASALLQLEFSEQIGQIDYTLTSFQKSVLNAIKDSKIVGISAPTSAGKSFALYLAIIRHAIKSDSSVIYIVPTISLINQVSSDLRSLLDRHDLPGWSVRIGLQEIQQRCIYVLTQERTLPSVDTKADLRSSVGLLIVDEVQNLERVQNDDDLRAKILYDAMREMAQHSPDARVILSGPRVSNIGELGKQIFGREGLEVSSGQSPVANVTYGVARRKGAMHLNQYSDFYRLGRSLPISNMDGVKGLGRTRYTADFLDYLYSVIQSLGEKSSNIVFAPTSEQARKTAVHLALSREVLVDPLREVLAGYLAETIHPEYSLVDAVRKGVGIHSGKVPPHARLVVEQAFSDGLLTDVVCTTTLMQGVNLPANLVIVRNPQLFINKRPNQQNPQLSQYEFANLRGRAGRLMRDFVGRTLVLDEDSFLIGGEQEELFPDAEKHVASGYRDLFSRNRYLVEADLAQPGSASGAAKFLSTYVRQTMLRHGDKATARLREVGVELPQSLLRSTWEQLLELDVPTEVCLANRYWDPVDLQSIKDNMQGGALRQLPTEPWSADEIVLEDWLNFQLRVVPYYFSRYLGSSSEHRLRTLSISALAWARERPLSEIIRKRHFSDDVSSKIEKQISDIHTCIVYGIPALLKPVADIQGSGHGFLSAIESGVFNPVTRLLIERGLYRETAILVQRKALSGLRGDEESLSRSVVDRLRSRKPFGYWVERQLNPVVTQWAKEI